MPLSKSTFGGGFKRIYVDYAVPGSARITWELRDEMKDPLPWDFQLQVSKDGGGDTWTNVGTTVSNAFYAIDDTQRQYGKGLRLAYRVVLTTPVTTYTSETAQVLGLLSKRQWLQARAIIRRTILMPRGLECLPGYLMKRKLHGTACTECVDPITGGITNSDCDTCKGTSRVDGYWKAFENNMYDLSPEGDDTKRTPKGTSNDIALVGSFTGMPMIHKNDIWIDANSDRRYVINQVRSVAEINRVPVIVRAQLRLAEFGDVIYSVEPTEGS
jgi:hypothetical protein